MSVKKISTRPAWFDNKSRTRQRAICDCKENNKFNAKYK